MFGAGAADSYSKMEGGGAGRGAAAAPAALNLGALGRGGNLTEVRRKRLREVIWRKGEISDLPSFPA